MKAWDNEGTNSKLETQKELTFFAARKAQSEI